MSSLVLQNLDSRHHEVFVAYVTVERLLQLRHAWVGRFAFVWLFLKSQEIEIGDFSMITALFRKNLTLNRFIAELIAFAI